MLGFVQLVLRAIEMIEYIFLNFGNQTVTEQNANSTNEIHKPVKRCVTVLLIRKFRSKDFD